MKHKIIFIIAVITVILSMLACGGRRDEPIHSQPEPEPEPVDTSQRAKIAYNTWTIKYGGCTYLQYRGDDMIHHEGCDNPIHVCK